MVSDYFVINLININRSSDLVFARMQMIFGITAELSCDFSYILNRPDSKF